ncbi:MAG TPA: hypothetical protein VHP31_10525 [Caproicibacter sp.]|nr:hypothetical protein [Caproicibacter sp.]
MRFVESPNLPDSDISLAMVSGTYPELIISLNCLGIQVIPVITRSRLNISVKNHADEVCIHLGGNNILLAPGESELKNILERHEFNVIDSSSEIHSPYPYEAKLNAARVGRYLITNQNIIDRTMLNYNLNSQTNIIDVKQGYAKCSTAVIDDHSIITSDNGIANATRASGLEVLQIRPGYIKLPGCNYGFIGGTCGKISKNKIAFAGRIQDHPDFPEIEDFLQRRKIEFVVLSDCPLTDIGGILPLQYS